MTKTTALFPSLTALAAGLFLFGLRHDERGIGRSGADEPQPENPRRRRLRVAVGVDKDKNTTMTVTVKHLAHPERLTPPASVYVAWLRSDPTGKPQNIGALTVDKDLNGSLATITPFRTFDVFVTAEAAAVVTEPSGDSLLWTTVNR